MSRLSFVVGKGGVGKTTVACGLAMHLASQNPRQSVLLMSTDPAHSLADMLRVPLKTAPSRITKARGRLFAWQIDSGREFQKFLSGNREAVLNIVEAGTFFSKEEIAPLLDTTLPGMAEMAGLLALQELLEAGEHQHIVVDTAPFGHTLRLFELPGYFQRFLDFLNVASRRDEVLAEHFGGHVESRTHAFLERWEEMVGQLREAFSARQAEIILVTSAETFSLNEAVRSLESLDQSVPEMKVGRIVLNRVVEKGGRCAHCSRRAALAARARQFLKRNFPRIPVEAGPDPGNPILGTALLGRFGEVVFGNSSGKLEARVPGASRSLRFAKASWPVAEAPLSFTVGKGGVGKTTTTAALAFHVRATHPKMPVTVCSTDPAPSLADIFEKPIGNTPTTVLGDAKLFAIEADSVSEFRRWAAHLHHKLDSELSMQTGGIHVDLTFEKQIFAALMEVVPPGVDEVFAIFRIVRLLEEKRGQVFIDMAPTGHALELLRMPERILLWSRLLLKSLAAHRTLALAQDVAVELASLGQQVRKLLEVMKDPRQSRIWAVMLAEPVPDRQTERLLRAVAEIGIQVDSLVVNRILSPEAAAECPRCRRAREWQLATLATLKKKFRSVRTYLAPEFPEEVAGAAALKRFTSELWRIAE